MRSETKRLFLISTEIFWFVSIFKKSQASAPFEGLNSVGLLRCQGKWGPLSRGGWGLGISLGTAQKIQTSLYLVRWKTSLHSSPCKQIWLSFEAGNIGIYCTWGSKFRDPHIYQVLSEGSSWGAFGKVAYLFNRFLGIRSLLELIWAACSFPRVPVVKLEFLYAWDGCLRESLKFP